MNAPNDLHPAIRRRDVPASMLDALRERFGERFSTSSAVLEQHGRGESVYDAAPPDTMRFMRDSSMLTTRRRPTRCCSANRPTRWPSSSGRPRRTACR
jgi:hypothetical protein